MKPPRPVTALVIRVSCTLIALAALACWAKQTPNGDALIARQHCAGQLVAGHESRC